ncbi:RNA uridylyltransferase [Malassezia sp. CBS 17886]|nr:RNA uridylyltransferase [Malassezia sp. CBS 17886]
MRSSVVRLLRIKTLPPRLHRLATGAEGGVRPVAPLAPVHKPASAAPSVLERLAAQDDVPANLRLVKYANRKERYWKAGRPDRSRVATFPTRDTEQRGGSATLAGTGRTTMCDSVKPEVGRSEANGMRARSAGRSEPVATRLPGKRRSLSSDAFPAPRAVRAQQHGGHGGIEVGGGRSAPTGRMGAGAHARARTGTPASGAMPPSYERHTADLTHAVTDFLAPMLPTEEEYRVKEGTRRRLERLAVRISPGAQLLAFGSMANGFALRNSDMDLCCLVHNTCDAAGAPRKSAAELVEILGDLIRQETDFTVLPLPHARVPIIKISRSATADEPHEIACDIGFDNQLALENTRLLLSYAMVDPVRLRTLVLFLKVWTKRRKLNAPFTGTLSSYGYTLMVLFFLIHAKRPPVLPNLQRVPAGRPLHRDEVVLHGHNVYFYDDIASLHMRWHSENTESVGELLLDFFRFFARDFNYARDVISTNTEGGLVAKERRGWAGEQLCIEDPFQMGYNVARTVTKDGLYTIRGEFMRASRLLANRSVRAASLLAQLCEEREDGLTRAPDFPVRSRAHHDGPRSLGRWPPDARRDAPAGGLGGSIAFEEMARGLGFGMAYPPPAAMLAPLSQTHGLYAPPRTALSADGSPPTRDALPSDYAIATAAIPPPGTVTYTTPSTPASAMRKKTLRSLSDTSTPSARPPSPLPPADLVDGMRALALPPHSANAWAALPDDHAPHVAPDRFPHPARNPPDVHGEATDAPDVFGMSPVE